jgi:Putative adhesin
MRNLLKPTILLAAAWLGFAPSAAAQNDFEWTGQLAPGQRIEIQDVNGSIHASAGGGNIVVTAVKRPGRTGNASDVRIETVAHSGGVTVCVIYGTGDCRAGGRGSNNSNTRNDTSVDFTVQVPAGIGLVAHTVNGSVDANGLQSDTDAATVNGSVTVATSGSASASTVNGSINAAMGRLPSGGKFKTVNGAVTLQLPGSTNADVRVSTVSGDIRSDFPLQIDTEPGPKRAEGVIGAGGQRLDISTVNGGVTLQRR